MNIRIGRQEIREILSDATWVGEGPEVFTGVAGLREARDGDISFLSRTRYAGQVAESAASLILVPRDFAQSPSPGQCFARVEHPSLALARICERIEKSLRTPPPAGIHPSAIVDSSAEIAPSATIGPCCVIEAGARIAAGVVLSAQVFVGEGASVGEGGWIYSQVSIHRHVQVGKRCILHSGVVLGSDGFGFEPTPQGHFKVPQIGGVEIGDDVEIGANSAVDRGRFAPTRVGRGTKIDNLVQIGHNAEIGEHCFLCAQAGVSGSTRIGNQVVIAGQAGIAGHLEIGDGIQIGAQSGVAKDLHGIAMVTGTPAQEFQKQRRLEALVRRLPQLFARVKELESMLPCESAQ